MDVLVACCNPLADGLRLMQSVCNFSVKCDLPWQCNAMHVSESCQRRRLLVWCTRTCLGITKSKCTAQRAAHLWTRRCGLHSALKPELPLCLQMDGAGGGTGVEASPSGRASPAASKQASHPRSLPKQAGSRYAHRWSQAQTHGWRHMRKMYSRPDWAQSNAVYQGCPAPQHTDLTPTVRPHHAGMLGPLLHYTSTKAVTEGVISCTCRCTQALPRL